MLVIDNLIRKWILLFLLLHSDINQDNFKSKENTAACNQRQCPANWLTDRRRDRQTNLTIISAVVVVVVVQGKLQTTSASKLHNQTTTSISRWKQNKVQSWSQQLLGISGTTKWDHFVFWNWWCQCKEMAPRAWLSMLLCCGAVSWSIGQDKYSGLDTNAYLACDIWNEEWNEVIYDNTEYPFKKSPFYCKKKSRELMPIEFFVYCQQNTFNGKPLNFNRDE